MMTSQNFLDGVTVNGISLQEYLQDKKGSDALSDALDFIKNIGRIRYHAPIVPKRSFIYREEKPQPVKIIGKEQYMEEQYEKLYAEHREKVEEWIADYIANNDEPLKGQIITAILQMGWHTNKGIIKRIKDIVGKYNLYAPTLDSLKPAGVSSRVSTFLNKPSKRSIFYALMEAEPVNKDEGRKTSQMRYRCWPPLVQVKPSDLYCLTKNPLHGKGQPFTLTDLKARIPEVSGYLKEKLPEAEKRTKRILERKIEKSKPEPKADEKILKESAERYKKTFSKDIYVVKEEVPDEDKVSAEEQGSVEKDAVLYDDKTPGPIVATNQGFGELVKYIAQLLPDRKLPEVERPALDININVNFSIGGRS